MKKAEEKGEKPKFKKIEGLNLPYVEFEMSSGEFILLLLGDFRRFIFSSIC